MPQLVAIFTAMVVGFSIMGPDSTGVYWGAAVFVLYSIGSRRLLARHHRKGIRLSGVGEFDAAIAEHEKSYEFFSHYGWLDRLRSIFLMSASAMSYREMALVNVAFCHSQVGRGAEAKQGYQRALQEFPGSVIASTALNLIHSAENAAR